MKLIFIDLVLASWLLIIVESLDYFPRQVNQRDELPYDPFIPGFKGYSSKHMFYQAFRSYLENPEYQGHLNGPEYTGRHEYAEYRRRDQCSGIKNGVNEAVNFCSHVLKRLKELNQRLLGCENELKDSLTELETLNGALMGCDKIDTPVGTKCDVDNKCYVVSEYYDLTQNMMYAAYLKACPCPQTYFKPGPPDATLAANFLLCLGQRNLSGKNEVVVTVDPDSNQCTSYAYNVEFGAVYLPSHDCTPSTMTNFLFVCEVPCNS